MHSLSNMQITAPINGAAVHDIKKAKVSSQTGCHFSQLLVYHTASILELLECQWQPQA